jgi:hypothetical protein
MYIGTTRKQKWWRVLLSASLSSRSGAKLCEASLVVKAKAIFPSSLKDQRLSATSGYGGGGHSGGYGGGYGGGCCGYCGNSQGLDVSTLVILGAIAAAAAALYVAIQAGKRRRRRDAAAAETPSSAKQGAVVDGLAARFVTSGRTFQHYFHTE